MTAHTNSYTGCRCDTRGAKGMFSQEFLIATTLQWHPSRGAKSENCMQRYLKVSQANIRKICCQMKPATVSANTKLPAGKLAGMLHVKHLAVAAVSNTPRINKPWCRGVNSRMLPYLLKRSTERLCLSATDLSQCTWIT